MDQVFNQPMRKSTQLSNSTALVKTTWSGARNMHERKREKQTSAFEVFYRQNKEIVWRAGILLFLFLLTNLITGLTVRNKVSTRLKMEHQIELQEELSAARTEIENEIRAQYGADEVDAQVAQINREADLLARMLYPYRDNTDEGLKSAVWCVLCRVQNSRYPDTVSEVVYQKDQWMGFAEDNPIVQRLRDIAVEQLRIYYSGSALPMSPEYVFMSWSSSEITLRSTFDGKGGCHYWYESDWR